ncbi:peptidase, S41A family [Formosa sp. Hel1_33_131]|uniref:S41 family peptidase n=1 Tax=Formosa sp. Hel1_33_131 TaxID=1336794 RepID=UPI00084E2AC7|nr:S41 family peptidase [Formosa sp. Hel1_33_131]AOR29419.1 peptidase, S41A family [Formosa sp. Hel1_33_131]
MNSIFKFALLSLVFSLTFSCFEDNDDTASGNSDIKNFVWKAMNFAYLYKDDSPNLANDRFGSDSDYQSFLNGYESPEGLFESLIYNRETVDRFSWITNDYIALEQQFSGVTKTNGAEFNFYYAPGSSSDAFGIVRLVQPNSNASATTLTRGHVFNKIDGVTLTEDNLRTLLSSETYTIHLATYNTNGTDVPEDDSLTDGTETITLTKTVYSENPIFKSEVITVNNENIGYLMYNGFVADYDAQLNTAFGEFQAQNIQKLILDLRYNPGGSVNSATALGSMITGLSNGIFAKLQYNSDLQSNNTNYDFTSTLSEGDAINSVGLDKVYVITTGSSASASEMIVNSLRSYIDVVQIGTKTVGKSQASITLYDSPDFQRQGANSGHLYALQPLVAITVNKDDQAVPSTGLTPTIEVKETVSNYGVLGDVNEPLLAAALAAIQAGRFAIDVNGITPILDSNSFKPHSQEMYLD